jgi:hypothetical protein
LTSGKVYWLASQEGLCSMEWVSKFFSVRFPISNICVSHSSAGRSKWPRGLRFGSVAVRLLGLRVRIPREHLRLSLSLSLECCVLSGRGLCVGRSLVYSNLTECLSECYLETSYMPCVTVKCLFVSMHHNKTVFS